MWELGAVIPYPGNSEEYKTGSWRTFKPVLHKDKCINCMICFMVCPDSSILVEDGKMIGFNYDHCKGCGLCAHECPKDAIEMIKERG